jgi:hypothetical protein
MKYMLLIMNGDQKNAFPAEPDFPAIFADFHKLTEEMQARGKFLHSARLRPGAEAKVVRVKRDRSSTITDGPFLETKEAVGGYFLVECASEAEAIEWARKFPPSFTVEARQVWEI